MFTSNELPAYKRLLRVSLYGNKKKTLFDAFFNLRSKRVEIKWWVQVCGGGGLWSEKKKMKTEGHKYSAAGAGQCVTPAPL